MFAKALIFAFVALVAFQSNVDAVPHHVSQKDNKAIIDVIQEIINKLKEIIQTVVEKAKEFIKQLIENIHDVAGEWIEAAKEQIEKLIAEIKEKIQQLIEQAQQIQVDVTECVAASQGAIDAIRAKLMTEIQACVGPTMEAILEIAHNAQVEISNIINKVRELEQRFKECSNIMCYMGVASDGYNLVKTIPDTVQEIIASVVEVANETGNEVPACIQGAVLGVQGELVAIQNEITQCIEDKINGSKIGLSQVFVLGDKDVK